MKFKFILILGMFICLGYGSYRFGLNQGVAKVNGTASVIQNEKVREAEKKPLYWHDPMNPNQRFDKPGKSPFMDMELVPVFADDHHDESNQVSIDPVVQQNLGIRTAVVTTGKLESAVTAVGTIAFNERDVALIQSRNTGFVEHAYVSALFDPVKKGQKLADVYVPDWIAAQEEYLTVQQMKGTNLEGMLDGALQRMRLAGMSEEQIAQVTTSGKVQARIAVVSPINGIITELDLREGMTLNAGATLFKVNGLSTVWVNAEVPENLSSQVRPGDLVEARVTAIAGTVFKGHVNAVLPEVNPITRTVKIRIVLTNPRGELLPGMFASIRFFSARESQPVVLVPSEAVIQTGTRTVVMVEQGAGKFGPVEIHAGKEGNGQTEVLHGLQAGQKVVLSGQFLIDSEASLKATATRMTEKAPETSDQQVTK